MQNILNRFRLSAPAAQCEPYGNGHINRTYLVTAQDGRRYILQKINDTIFQDVDMLMDNIVRVTGHLKQQGLSGRQVLTLVKTTEDKFWLRAPEGCFRVYEFIEDSLCLERAETAEDFRQSAVAFGQFQRQLATFPAGTLGETIPRFHDTPNRMRLLQEAVQADAAGRADSVRQEIAFCMARQAEAESLMSLLAAGELPLRVTHNDTKLNNVMLDKTTRTPLCVIDLDTVMPGLAANDFGDSIRFGASSAAEDETDLSRVEMLLPLYSAYAEGFLSACGGSLTRREIETLPMGAILMTLECGVRFLTDYLQGDVYFRIHRPEHNLDRCRTQLKLVRDMEEKLPEMQKIVGAC